ncbi:MAG: 50S ribosomal protein L9 [Microscillaceae bacterium]|nr:50S ribosomal protein L9 [Microscillaceae bacterium]
MQNGNYLKEDVLGLGYKNDLKKVKPGYARNYLIPKGLAIAANETNKKILAENLRQAAHKAEKLKLDAEALAAQIAEVSLEIAAKVSETGKIFGAVTSIQVADALKIKGLDIDRRKIVFEQKEIKVLGDYTALVDLHREVKATLKFKVVEA